MKKYQTRIHLTILGPFLTAATASEVYGLQKAFFRNTKSKPVIPSSHVKGKLRMALEELSAIDVPKLDIDINLWFGTSSEEEKYEPLPGLLTFSDFRFTGKVSESTRTRTAIDPRSGTAAEKQLRQVEDLFLSGIFTIWEGNITFYADDKNEAIRVKDALQMGFIWLTNLGAEKGVGFGRLAKVQLTNPVPVDLPAFDLVILGDAETINIRIQPIERIMIGGVKKPRTNFVRSERIIPGSVIKGALTMCLNQAHGIRPLHLPLSKEIADQMPDYRLLASNLDLIRVTHAFPANVGKPRPVKIPISTVEAGGVEYDLALTPEPSVLFDGQAPRYFIDQKHPPEYIGAASPKEIFLTRTEIDDETRRSQERNLFTYSYLCPEDSHGNPIEWVSNVDFSAIDDPHIRRQVRDQFALAVSAYLDRMGKLNQGVKVNLSPGYAQPAEVSRDDKVDEVILLTLQSDAIMLNPEDVRNLDFTDDLFWLYAKFWEDISDLDGKGPCLELVDYYALQNFQGGYLYHRYLGAGERQQNPNKYYPYYLTGAGSVFRLHATNTETARVCLQRWLHRGLDLPTWARLLYGQYDRALWQNCPFVPENGYGEIAINLNWHWEKQAR